MSEQPKTAQDGAPREEAELESADLHESELEKVSGGGPGGNMEVQQKGGDSGTAGVG